MPTVLHVAGIEMLDIDEHPENAAFPIIVIDEESILFSKFNFTQFWKALFPIIEHVDGISTFVKTEHPENEETPKVVNLEVPRNVILLILLFWKALVPIVNKLGGNINDCNPVQPLKALFPMFDS